MKVATNDTGLVNIIRTTEYIDYDDSNSPHPASEIKEHD
jgi:hypothetical protein